MQPAVTSHFAPSSQQLVSPQVAQAPAGKTPMQLPAPPVPELVAVDVLPVLVDEASLVLVEVVADPPDPPDPVVPVAPDEHAAVPRGVMTAATRSQGRMFMGALRGVKGDEVAREDRAGGRGFEPISGAVASLGP